MSSLAGICGDLLSLRTARVSTTFTKLLEAQSDPSTAPRTTHVLGTPFSEDRRFSLRARTRRLRLGLISDSKRLVFLDIDFLKELSPIFTWNVFETTDMAQPIFRGIDYSLGLQLVDDRMFAITDRDAPNRRIVEIHLRENERTNGSTSFPKQMPPSELGSSLVTGWLSPTQRR